jgi:lysozyme
VVVTHSIQGVFLCQQKTSFTRQENMKTSQSGIDFIKIVEEGDLAHLDKVPPPKLHAYNDGVGVWTIAWGCTEGVRKGMVITAAQAQLMIEAELRKFEIAVGKLVKVPLNQGQFDVLVSFSYNVGVGALGGSTLLKKLNAGDYAAVPSELLKWDHGGGKVMPGLTARRRVEGERWRTATAHHVLAETPVPAQPIAVPAEP